jgi:hypothetical protein
VSEEDQVLRRTGEVNVDGHCVSFVAVPAEWLLTVHYGRLSAAETITSIQALQFKSLRDCVKLLAEKMLSEGQEGRLR